MTCVPLRFLLPALAVGLGISAAGCDDSHAVCAPDDHTSCVQDVTYWLDSCGEISAVVGICDCGCNADLTACETQCACTPDCDGRLCGDDTCGGSCGDCPAGQACDAAGQCFDCTPECDGRLCGDDACGGSCGTCPAGETCDATGQCEGDAPNVLRFEHCDVPFVLDAARITDQSYMISHFGELMQFYCVTGVVDGSDIASFPEKLYYGQRDDETGTLSLVQTTMTSALAPTWSVKVDFSPDTDVTTGSVWQTVLGDATPQAAVVGLIQYGEQNATCLWALGTSGSLAFASAQDVTEIEGGSFSVSGQAQMSNPWELGAVCANTPPNMPCCPR